MRTKLFKIESPQFFFFRKTTTKNCLKIVWGFKMSCFEEDIEFNFEDLDNESILLTFEKNTGGLSSNGRAFDSHSRGRGIDTSSLHLFFFLV